VQRRDKGCSRDRGGGPESEIPCAPAAVATGSQDRETAEPDREAEQAAIETPDKTGEDDYMSASLVAKMDFGQPIIGRNPAVFVQAPAFPPFSLRPAERGLALTRFALSRPKWISPPA